MKAGKAMAVLSRTRILALVLAVGIVSLPASAATSTGVDQKSADLSADLGLRLLEAMNSQANQAVSPFGMANALGVLSLGAGGNTALELHQLLGPPNGASPSSEGVQIHNFNRIFINKKIAQSVNKKFLKQAKAHFRARAKFLDMAQVNATLEVNQWMAQRTNGRIQSLLPEGALEGQTNVVITNATTFKGQWKTAFQRQHTEPRAFHNALGQEIGQVPMMAGELEVGVARVGNQIAYELPFEGELYALRLLPLPEGGAMNTWKSSLTGERFRQMGDAMVVRRCVVVIPKFQILPSPNSMKSALEPLGVTTMFGDQADFTPMLGSKGKLVKVDKLYHAVGISIDEEGALATSATAAVLKSKSFKPVCMVDRPFLYAIVHKSSGMPMFMGYMESPITP